MPAEFIAGLAVLAALVLSGLWLLGVNTAPPSAVRDPELAWFLDSLPIAALCGVAGVAVWLLS